MLLWPWWLGAIGLAGTAVAYLIVIRRPLGVSGVVNTLLDPMARQNELELASVDDDALQQALMEATRAQFGDASSDPVAVITTATAKPLGWSHSLLFLVGIVLGGGVFALVAPTTAIELQPSGVFAQLFGGLMWPALFVGGVLAGVGTSMAGGCTSGHGLVGCGRLQVPSLVATACFFGMAIVVSFLLKAVLL